MLQATSYLILSAQNYSKQVIPIPLSLTINEATAVFISQTMRDLGLSLVSIFIPIYIFTLNFPLIFSNKQFSNSIILVALFYLIESLSVLFICFFFSRIIFNYFSLKKLLVLSSIVLIISLILLNNLQKYPNLVYIIPALLGFYIVVYWIPYHMFFTQKNRNVDGGYGKNVGIAAFLNRIVNAIGPLIGGFVIARTGFSILFIFASLVIFASVLPILLEVKETQQYSSPFKNISLNYIFNDNYKFISLGFVGISLESVAYIIFWPILLYLSFKTFTHLGILAFISLLLSAFAMLAVGRLIDSKNRNLGHFLGVVLTATFHILRVFFTSISLLSLVEVLDRLTTGLYNLPFNAKVYEVANKNSIDFLVYREFILHFSRIVGLIVAVGIVLYFDNWKYVFFIGTAGAITSYLVNFVEKKSILGQLKGTILGN